MSSADATLLASLGATPSASGVAVTETTSRVASVFFPSFRGNTLFTLRPGVIAKSRRSNAASPYVLSPSLTTNEDTLGAYASVFGFTKSVQRSWRLSSIAASPRATATLCVDTKRRAGAGGTSEGVEGTAAAAAAAAEGASIARTSRRKRGARGRDDAFARPDGSAVLFRIFERRSARRRARTRGRDAPCSSSTSSRASTSRTGTSCSARR
eukprot:31510-Pelagococcus_subviridis.AAC.14